MMERRKDSKNRVLKEGEYQRKDLSYEYKWRDPLGKRHSIYAQTLESLREKEKEVTQDILIGKPADADKVTLNEMYARWLQLKRNTVKDNTLSHYIYSYTQYVEKDFGKRKIATIKKSDICAFYNHLHVKRELSCSTISSLHTVLIQVFTMAFDDGYMRINPAPNAYKVFKTGTVDDTEKRKALTVEQQDLLERYLSKNLKANQWYPITIVLLYTGLRAGECTGLRWCDIDLEKGIIDVNHTLAYYYQKDSDKEKSGKFSAATRTTLAIFSPKTEAGKRTIPMSNKVREAFIAEKERQDELGISCDVVIDGYTDFIFLNRFGKPYNSQTLNLTFDRIVRNCNLAELEKYKNKKSSPPVLLPHFTCHNLRHTFATRSVEAGLSLKALTTILGHSSADITLDIYTDCSEEFKRSEMLKIEALAASFGADEEPVNDHEKTYDQQYDSFTTNE